MPFSDLEAMINRDVLKHTGSDRVVYTDSQAVVHDFDPAQGKYARFDKAGRLEDVVEGAPVITIAPLLFIPTDEVDAQRGDTVVVNGVNYTVSESLPDGSGLTICKLRKA